MNQNTPEVLLWAGCLSTVTTNHYFTIPIPCSPFCAQGRIKKIMQSDEEVGKVAQAVPIIIYILFKA